MRRVMARKPQSTSGDDGLQNFLTRLPFFLSRNHCLIHTGPNRGNGASRILHIEVAVMKFVPARTLLSALVTLLFVLTAVVAQAMPIVELDSNDNVINILDLPVINQFEMTTIYNVQFLQATAFEVYGQELAYDLNDEDAALALIEVLAALNENNPLPEGAGPEGSDTFFIGAFTEEIFVVAVGGQRFPGAWEECEFDSNRCINGVTVHMPDQLLTYAKFTVVPEPGTALLMGLGLAGLSLPGRRRP
jgi:hypothetical protein